MPNLDQAQRTSVESSVDQAVRVNRKAHEFRHSLQQLVQHYGANFGITWAEIDGLPEPGFGLDLGFAIVVAGFELAQREGEIIGIYRLHRYSGHPIEPKLTEFWGFAMSRSGQAAWSVSAPWEWKTEVSKDIADFVFRVQHEYFEAIKIG